MKNIKKLLALAMVISFLFAMMSISAFARDSAIIDVPGQYKFVGYILYIQGELNARSEVTGYANATVDTMCQLIIEDQSGGIQSVWSPGSAQIGNNVYTAIATYAIPETSINRAYSDNHVSYNGEWVAAYTLEYEK